VRIAQPEPCGRKVGHPSAARRGIEAKSPSPPPHRGAGADPAIPAIGASGSEASLLPDINRSPRQPPRDGPHQGGCRPDMFRRQERADGVHHSSSPTPTSEGCSYHRRTGRLDGIPWPVVSGGWKPMLRAAPSSMPFTRQAGRVRAGGRSGRAPPEEQGIRSRRMRASAAACAPARSAPSRPHPIRSGAGRHGRPRAGLRDWPPSNHGQFGRIGMTRDGRKTAGRVTLSSTGKLAHLADLSFDEGKRTCTRIPRFARGREDDTWPEMFA